MHGHRTDYCRRPFRARSCCPQRMVVERPRRLVPDYKTVYARPRFDFMAERALYVREALHFANLAPQRRSETKLSNSPQSGLPLSKD
jgi:hypothetical protein